MASSNPETAADERFEAYLVDHEIAYEYEPPWEEHLAVSAEVNPDFLIDPAGRGFTDRTPVHREDRHGAARAQTSRRELLQPGRHRAAYVRDALVVECLPGLLVVVRDLKVPEDRRFDGGPPKVSVPWRHSWVHNR